ncbi:unnamed protein product [Brachionus calyciflorus]|uniref:Uncharacterized protein n=1 Tax=Brachionus calyciflorus TaxID=104777 RepID=A0A813Z7Q1_9BILA|nr:unnamed protein product [Brachionus calyciflorus]
MGRKYQKRIVLKTVVLNFLSNQQPKFGQVDFSAGKIEENSAFSNLKQTKSESILVQNLKKYQSNGERKHEIASIEEDMYELYYQRKHYDVIIQAESLDEFSDIYERLAEIENKTGVRNPEMILPIKDKNSKIIKLKIRVKNLSDYKILLDWPLDSFKTGVNVFPVAHKYGVIIENIEQKIQINQKNADIIKLANRYNLFNIKRIHNHRNKPTRKVMAFCKTVSDLVFVLKNGIEFGQDNKKHLVLPNIKNYKICDECGGLNHQKKIVIKNKNA